MTVNHSSFPTKRKVCVVVTARASYSRIRTALHAIQDHPHLELQLVLSGSAVLKRFGELGSCIEADGFEVSARIHMLVEGESLVTAAKSTGIGLVELSTVFDQLKPDIVVSIADRYETIATAIAASYMNIPLAHMQGGEITGSIDEKVRHAITKLSDVHFVCTNEARNNVVRMGEDPEKVFVTGCPSIDLAAEILASPEIQENPIEVSGGVGADIDFKQDYVVVLQHPVTTEHEQAREQVMETLLAVHELNIPTVWFWPNADAGSDGTSNGIRAFREHFPKNKIHFFKHLDSLEFLRVVYNSKCLIGNSSAGVRECSYLGVPVVNIGTRQNRRERGNNVLDVSYNKIEIMQAIQKHFSVGKYPLNTLYGDANAGRKIAQLLNTVPLTFEKTLTFEKSSHSHSAVKGPHTVFPSLRKKVA